MSLAVIKSLSL